MQLFLKVALVVFLILLIARLARADTGRGRKVVCFGMILFGILFLSVNIAVMIQNMRGRTLASDWAIAVVLGVITFLTWVFSELRPPESKERRTHVANEQTNSHANFVQPISKDYETQPLALVMIRHPDDLLKLREGSFLENRFEGLEAESRRRT